MSKITLFTTKPTGGGAEKILTSLARHFSENGIETDFLVLDTGDRPFNSGQANVIEIPHSRIRYTIPWLVRYLNDVTPNLILSTLTGPNLVTILASNISRTDSTVAVREAAMRSISADVTNSKKAYLMNTAIRILYPRTDNIVTISKGAEKSMREFLGNGSGNIVTIPNPIDVSRVQQVSSEPVTHDWFTEEYNVILGVGRFVPSKDFETLIKAYERFSGEMDRLVLLGDGKEREHLERLVKQRDISSVDFLGYVDNPYRYMKRADVFVSTSRYETFGNVILEALACGTPVVATDCPGGPPEILDGGKYGELAPVGDVDQIAKCISKVVNDGYDQDVLVNRAEDYAIESIASRYMNLV